MIPTLPQDDPKVAELVARAQEDLWHFRFCAWAVAQDVADLRKLGLPELAEKVLAQARRTIRVAWAPPF